MPVLTLVFAVALSPPPDNRDAGRDLDEVQLDRQWTPEPEPSDTDNYTAWGRKHYGDDWYEQREVMLKERDFYDWGVNVNNDRVYIERQEALRNMESEREKGKLPKPKGKTYQELMAWARTHYGEVCDPIYCQ
ncbi:hypothetical protein HRG_001289 [Hirsutella rhossiliensis]|uniref:Uncharacterized protein n=1 Tax=Hirsutella rhossiliensis TaxID=111463 RepID=A0A9P8N8U0_9HYPO|nr:uncharacterized protein HRG_01289 [Hirsutella rhossiliensis]KAH0968647.1 hypothetical protein HRG_01289 [Hirsutella rhossiliensis]